MEVKINWFIEQLKEELKKAENGYKIDFLRDAIHKLRNGYTLKWVKPVSNNLLGDNIKVEHVEKNKFIINKK